MTPNTTLRSTVTLTLHGSESDPSGLLDFSRFLYIFNLVYEISRLSIDPAYGQFDFPQYTFAPAASSLNPHDQLELTKISRQSPWELSVLLPNTAAGLGAVLLLLQVIEKISTWTLNRQKLTAEAEKVGLEAEKLRLEQTLAERRRIDEENQRIREEEQKLARNNQIERTNRLPVEDLPRIPVSVGTEEQVSGTPLPDRLGPINHQVEKSGGAKFYNRSLRTLIKLRFGIVDVEVEFKNESSNQ
jgi:hypothetical protein